MWTPCYRTIHANPPDPWEERAPRHHIQSPPTREPQSSINAEYLPTPFVRRRTDTGPMASGVTFPAIVLSSRIIGDWYSLPREVMSDAYTLVEASFQPSLWTLKELLSPKQITPTELEVAHNYLLYFMLQCSHSDTTNCSVGWRWSSCIKKPLLKK